MLRDVVAALPLRVPFEDATVMSGFGYRRDPVSGAAAMHSGLDLSGPMRAEIRPTAPGRVIFAGWQGEYGRVVDIDHGFGIRTRYAHLSRTLVEAGDAVTVEDRIGLLGNSGRTTGPHLHYEVLIKGKNVDPGKFLKARDHVLQGR
jgi:murein DD-endopeptidase MepM/ murein hydrolase activator NlpD